MNKLLVIDYSELFYQSIFASRRLAINEGGYKMPFEYLLLRKIATLHKKFPDREVVLVGDGRQSWRKQLYPDYKATRKSFRESYKDMDWGDLFQRYSTLLSMLDTHTPIKVYLDEFLESDDLVAGLAKSGVDIVAVSSDKDLHQLCIYPNVQLVSPRSPKLKIKEIKNPKAELTKLIEGGDEADNIPRAKTPSQRLINQKLVDLTTLPDVIVKRIDEVLNQKREKALDLDTFTNHYRYKFLGDFLREL